MSGYSYGHRSGAGTRFIGGGGIQASYAANPHAGEQPASGHHSYGAMSYQHIPAISESADFGGNYASGDQMNCYQRQSQTPQTHPPRMNSTNMHGDSRGLSETNAYNRHPSAGMQTAYSAMSVPGAPATRRSSVPPNVAMNSFSTMQRSHSFTGQSDSQYSNRNNAMAQSQYQSNCSSQTQHFGDGYGGYGAQIQAQSSLTYNRSSMVKSANVWDRSNQSQMGPNSFSTTHAANAAFSHKSATNHHFQSGMPYQSSQTNSQNMYAADSSGMHSSSVVNGGAAASEYEMRGNQSVHSSTKSMMGQSQSYGNNQAMYGTSVGNIAGRMRTPNQRPVAGSMYNSYQSGNQMPGSLQRLKHFGPMPNSSSGYSRTNVRPSDVQNHGTNSVMKNAGNGGNSMAGGLQGSWQSGNNASNGYAAQNLHTSTQMTSNVPFNGLPHQSNMQSQSVNYNPNSNFGMSHQQQTSQNCSAPMHSNAMMDNTTSSTSAVYGQSGTTNSSQFPTTGCQEKIDPSSVACLSDLSSDTDAMIQQLNQDRIFSAELEKLAWLSRNPMSDDSNADAVAITSTMSTTMPMADSVVMSSACAGSNAFQSQTSVDDMLDGGTCVTASNPEQNSKTGNTNAQMGGVSGGSRSPNTSAAGTFQQGNSSMPCQQEQASSSSAPQTPNSTVNTNKSAPNNASGNSTIDTNTDSNKNKQAGSGDGSDSQNSVQQLQRMTQSIKDTSKQDELMKVASSQHAEYLSHSSSDGYGSQNCIAALSAACRNIIADMDNSMPKPNGSQKVQSPLGSKNNKFDLGPGYGGKSDALSGFGSGPPSVTSMGDQFVSPSTCMMTPTINCVPMDAFPTNFNGANPMSMPDYQGKFHDYLEQNVPMQMGGRRMDEKPRKGRRRRKSEEFSTEQLISCSMMPAKPKRKYRKRSAQNPPSVESMEGPLSVDNAVFTPLSESSSHQADDMGYRSATQTPNSVHNSWGMEPKMSCSDSISIAMSIADGNQMEHVSQDLLDSVFSPDTTMSSTTNHEPQESGNGMMQGSPVMHNQSPLGPPHLNNNHPMNATQKHTMFPPQSNNTVSSTGEANCPYISTSTNSANINTKNKESEEAHPLEILQAQIKMQRKQFNLGDGQQAQNNAQKDNVKAANNVRTEEPLPSDLDMDLLSSEETAWYLSGDQPKDGGGGGLWEDLCPKGQTNTSSKPLLLAMQS